MTTTDPEHQKPDARPVTLLLVDDEPAVLQSIRRLLKGDGYQIHLAETGEQALSCLEEERIDVVLSDIQMPGMRGTELMARIAARWPDTSRIALTGGADIADAVEAINSGGIFRWVTKPWDPDELRQTVRQAATRAQKIQATRRRLRIPARPAHGEDTVPHVIKRFFKGEMLFKEGSLGHQVHFVRVGRVELSMERDGRRLVVDTRGPGDCLGVGASVVKGARAVTATATELTETFCVSSEVVEQLSARNDPLIAAMLKSLAEQSRRTLLDLAMRDPVVNPIVSAAYALDLMARSYSPPGPSSGKTQSTIAKIPGAEVVEVLSSLTGMMKESANALLGLMASLSLVAIDSSRLVYVKPGEIVTAAKKLHANHGDTLAPGLRAEAELMTLEEMAELVGVDKGIIQAKLKQGELPEALWAFRKSETLRLVSEKGREFFRKRTRKKLEELDEIGDILLIDRDTLGRVFGRMDPDRLAMLLKPQPDEVRERALGALSKRVQAMVLETMADIEHVDPALVDLMEVETIDRIKELKGVGAAEPRH